MQIISISPVTSPKKQQPQRFVNKSCIYLHRGRDNKLNELIWSDNIVEIF